MVKFTPTERRILDKLSDMREHTLKELRDCLDNKDAEVNTVYVHLMRIRGKIETQGQSIALIMRDRKRYYIMIELRKSPYDGRS